MWHDVLNQNVTDLLSESPTGLNLPLPWRVSPSLRNLGWAVPHMICDAVWSADRPDFTGGGWVTVSMTTPKP